MSGRFVTYKKYVAGWFDSSLHDFLEVLSPPVADIKYALVTCLDSNPNPASLLDKSPELKSIAGKLEVLDTSLLLPTRLLLKTELSKRIFFGFDEVWFFPDKNMQPKPASASLVGPARLTQTRLGKCGKWMAANACSLALGGGEGLHFVVSAQGLLRCLLGSTLEQPEPAFAPA